MRRQALREIGSGALSCLQCWSRKPSQYSWLLAAGTCYRPSLNLESCIRTPGSFLNDVSSQGLYCHFSYFVWSWPGSGVSCESRSKPEHSPKPNSELFKPGGSSWTGIGVVLGSVLYLKTLLFYFLCSCNFPKKYLGTRLKEFGLLSSKLW